MTIQYRTPPTRSKAVIEVDIDARQKRLALIRGEERKLVEELSGLWNEHKELTAGAMAAKDA